MKRNFFTVLSIFLLSFLILTFYGCEPVDKTITLSNSVQEDMKVTEKSIFEALYEGSTLLAREKFEDAKASFERAISFDRSNTNTYLEIKDRYLSLNRLDDAYYFIKLAIDNNVDNDNMIALSKDIKSRFETTTLNNTISINSIFNLPKKIEMIINGKSEKVNIEWDNSNVDTSKLGTFSFSGTSSEYNRNVIFSLTVREPIKEKKMGFIANLYEKDGRSYITFDEVQFFINTENDNAATNEALKDGLSSAYFSPEGYYYLRNSSLSTKDYIISKNSSYWLADSFVGGTSNSKNTSVDYDTFLDFLAKYDTLSGYDNYRSYKYRLCWISTEDGVITKIDMKYLH